MIVVFFLFLSIFLSNGQNCDPRLIVEIGPAYKLNSPRKNGTLCEDSQNNYLKNVLVDSCSDTICWKARVDKVPSNRLLISGKVTDSTNCTALGEVVLDMWQTSALGRYGSLRDGVEDDFCRAKIYTDAEGNFQFETDYPGNYGAFFGSGPSFLPDVPPYGPRHIHIIAYKEGYEPWISQMYFPNDTNGVDWREALYDTNESKLHSMAPSLLLNITKLQDSRHFATFDISLTPTNRTDHLSYNDLLYQLICVELETLRPIPLCYPSYTFLINYKIIVTVIFGIICIFYYGTKYLVLTYCLSQPTTKVNK
jgi:protocatechuate 3,4-dioxygenase beta subunit